MKKLIKMKRIKKKLPITLDKSNEEDINNEMNNISKSNKEEIRESVDELNKDRNL